jgi:2',3'-cyclic-nucleotide 2'-phosphodiesterase (5'-nucleotidase family)
VLPLLTAFSFLTAPVRDTAHLVVVATTDVHGHVTDWDYVHNRTFRGGLVRVATIVDSLRAKYPGQVIVADAGDVVQGDPFATYFGRVAPRDPSPVIEAMNLIGYDVATLGEHEFDGGMAALRRTLAGAAYPYVSGNIYTLAGDTLLFPGYVVLQRNGVRVGVTGFTTPGVMVWDRDQVRSSIRMERIPLAAARVLNALRRESDISLVLVHSGIDGASSYDTAGVGAENVAAALGSGAVRPALVVAGHSHREIRELVINGVHFTQPRPFAGSVSVTHIDLVRDNDRWLPSAIRSELIPTAGVMASPRLVQRLAPEHAAVLSWVQQPVGIARSHMPAVGARAGPTPIVNFINTVQQRRSGADLSATPAFDVAAGFDRDTIRMADLLELYPTDNTLRAIRLTGGQLKQYLEHSAEYFRTDAVGRVSLNDSTSGDDFDIIFGARYDIDLRRRVGDRIRNLEIKGRPVSAAGSYTLALGSSRQTGSGGYSMVRGAPMVYDKGESIRDLLVAEIKQRGEIDSADYAAREWRIVPEGSALAVRQLFGVPAQPTPEAAQDTVLLRVLATSDLHGTLLSRVRSPDEGASGGVAAIAASMDSLAAECGCPTLRLDAGDALQGTVTANVTHGRAMVDVLNHLGIVAGVVGERDLEWSLDTLRRRMSEANFPLLAANVFDSAGAGRPEWALPYHLVKAGNYTVAVVGYITSDTKTSLKPRLTAGIRFGDGAIALHDVLTELREKHPDVTILLAHAGLTCEQSVCSGEVIRLVEGVEPRTVDLVIAGHSPAPVSTRTASVPIVQGAEGGAALAVADLVKTPAGGREIRTRIEPVSEERLTPNAAVAELAASYRRKADALISRPVATIKFPLPRTGDQSRLGMLISEARRNVLRADVGLVRNEDIRADLSAGPVSYGQLFEAQSSQNGMVKVTLSGRRLQEVLEQALDRQGRPAAHVAGVTVEYDPRRPPLKRIRQIELPGGKKLRAGDSYILATDDFVSGGGAGYSALVGLPAEPAGMLDVDALALYLRRLPQPVVAPAGQGFTSTR